MIILSATTETLLVKLGESTSSSALDVQASYVDVNVATQVYTPGETTSLTQTDTTTQTIVSAPSSNLYRQIKSLSVYNKDTISHNVLIQKDISGTAKTLVKLSLAINETLQYIDGEGFSILKATGDLNTIPAPNFAISAGTNSYSSGNINFSYSNNVSFGLTTGSKITAQVPYDTASWWAPAHSNMVTFAPNTSTAGTPYNMSIQRLFIPYYMTLTRLDMLAHLSVSGSVQASWAVSVALYTRNVSTLSLAAVNPLTAFSSQSWTSGGSTSVSSMYSGVSGTRWRSIALSSWNITPGEYWFANMWTATNSGASTVSLVLWGNTTFGLQGMPGADNDVIGFGGIWTAAMVNFSSSLALSDIRWCHSSSNSSIVSYVNRQPNFILFGSH